VSLVRKVDQAVIERRRLRKAERRERRARGERPNPEWGRPWPLPSRKRRRPPRKRRRKRINPPPPVTEDGKRIYRSKGIVGR
jgi:hypothetical protein